MYLKKWNSHKLSKFTLIYNLQIEVHIYTYAFDYKGQLCNLLCNETFVPVVKYANAHVYMKHQSIALLCNQKHYLISIMYGII